ncbi:HNH endonuclease family protein [Pseudidiomarina sp.]|uniref:HNH endonuclease family protein n=1 Tax=Pseudidiomarina sp. TaxID=2081707 RepID=UPI003A973E96
MLEDKFTTKSLHSNEGEKLTVPELYRYVSSLKSSVEKWYEISNPKGSSLDPEIARWLDKINRINIDECLPLIMVSLQKENDQSLLVKFIKSLEKLLFCIILANRSYRITFNPSVFIEWASSLSNDDMALDKIISKIDDAAEDFAKDMSMHRTISESFKDGGFYRWRGLRYFMYEYEQELKEKSKTYTDKLRWEDIADDQRDHKTIEHIYPQNPRKACWVDKYKHYTSKERSMLRHSIGNLVPLSQPKNSSFQNKPFLEKVGNSKTTIGFKYGSFSEIEVANNKEWTAIEIVKRNVKLLKFMEKRWGINFGGVGKMIEFVNLGFVLKKEGLVLHNNAIQPTQKTRG